MIRDIVIMPDDILRRQMPDIDDLKKARQVLKDLVDTMLDSGAVGFAANQINEPYNICIAKIWGREKDLYHEFINPQIIRRDGIGNSWEGCFSLPGYSALIPRSTTIYISHLTRNGKPAVSLITGPESFFAQHEIEHLQGILISDYVEGKNGKSGGTLLHGNNTKSRTVEYQKERKMLKQAT